jgi:branched-chain amino acid transport system permease protein
MMIVQFLINGLVNGSLIALTALGFSLVYNTMRVFHIAYAGIFLWAGYMFYFFKVQLAWPLFPSFLMAMLAAALLSVICELLLYRPLQKRGRSHNALMISSVGMLILLVSLLEMLFGNAALFTGFMVNDLLPLKINLSGLRQVSLLISLSLAALFYVYLKYTGAGISIRAMRDNETLSRLYGVRPANVKLFLYTLSGVFAAVASCLLTLDVGINPQMGIPVFINAFVALVIGGIGRFEGPLLGGLLLGVLQALTEYAFDSRWVMMLTFILLIIFLLFKPQGLIPERSRSY